MEKSLQRQSIRNDVRKKRRALTPAQQQQYALTISQRVMSHPRVMDAAQLAIFLSFDGELDTGPLIAALRLAGKQVYLPVLHPFTPGHLLFLRYDSHTPMVTNRLHIREPRLDITRLLPVDRLDILFTPLVAFDDTGQRLGMGGGFYDRTLMHWHRRLDGPLAIGLAHDCQQVDAIPAERWDIPLQEIITPSRHWRW